MHVKEVSLPRRRMARQCRSQAGSVQPYGYMTSARTCPVSNRLEWQWRNAHVRHKR